VEEWFYLLLPLGLLVLVRTGLPLRTAMLFLIVVTAATSPLYRYYRFQEFETVNLLLWDAELRKQVVTRLDSIIYGVLGAWLAHYHSVAWHRHRYLACGAGLVLLLVHKLTLYFWMDDLGEHGFYFSVVSFMTVAAGTLLLLPCLSRWHLRQGRFYRWVTLISLISYSMYLVHLSVVQRIVLPWCMQWLPAIEDDARVLVFYGLYWLLTLSLSVMLYRVFELPVMNLRERLGHRRSAA
jgi:peptidoglycan/LPS O-acetylase OafA/YrhL